MEIIIILLLLLAGILFLLAEVYRTPAPRPAARQSPGRVAPATSHALPPLGTTAGIITLCVSLLAGAGALAGFMRSKTLDRISLKTTLTGTVRRDDSAQIEVGDTGVTLTRLALIGQARFGQHIVEVKSASGLLDENTPVRVSRFADGIWWVERC